MNYCQLFKQYPLVPFPTSSVAFIRSVAPGAVTSQWVTSVPASITIAQALIESGCPSKCSALAKQANNLFGITGRDGNCGYVNMLTTEYDSEGAPYQICADFKKYCSVAAGIVDHGYWFLDNSLHQTALRNAANAGEFARQIAKAGYATDPTYAAQIIRYMNQYKLRQYDLVQG